MMELFWVTRVSCSSTTPLHLFSCQPFSFDWVVLPAKGEGRCVFALHAPGPAHPHTVLLPLVSPLGPPSWGEGAEALKLGPWRPRPQTQPPGYEKQKLSQNGQSGVKEPLLNHSGLPSSPSSGQL